jgi:hypothetical protein
MVRLARRYGLSRVAQVLRVNYTALKHRLVATAAAQAPRSGAIAAEFVEVPMTACPSPTFATGGGVTLKTPENRGVLRKGLHQTHGISNWPF